mgnify:FL=1
MNRLLISTAAALALGTTLAQAGGDPALGKEKATTCIACHGETGVSAIPIYPHIGGQYEDYLLHALKAYKSGERKNAVMQGMVAPLSEEDLENLAAYYASLEGVLKEGDVRP